MYGKIKSVFMKDGFIEIGIKFDSYLSSKLKTQKSFCPASLMVNAESDEEICEVHRFIGDSGDQCIFRTYNIRNLPVINSRIYFRSWWTDHEIDLIKNLTLNWVLVEYPSNGDHDHCPLTWKKISAKGPEKFGYLAKSNWISIEAYERFIKNDELQLRL